MSPRRRKAETEQAGENAAAWSTIARDVERRQVDALLAAIGGGSLTFQPALVAALLRRYLLESDGFAEWLQAEATRALRDVRRAA